jgi:hypothetical protein
VIGVSVRAGHSATRDVDSVHLHSAQQLLIARVAADRVEAHIALEPGHQDVVLFETAAKVLEHASCVSQSHMDTSEDYRYPATISESRTTWMSPSPTCSSFISSAEYWKLMASVRIIPRMPVSRP